MSRVQSMSQYKYTFLYAALLLLLVAAPHLAGGRRMAVPVILVALMIAIVRAVDLGRGLSRLCWALALGALVVQSTGTILDRTSGLETAKPLLIVGLAAYVLFFVVVIAILMKNIFTQTRVTPDTIRGGISIYFLMGILWAVAYRIGFIMDPDAISVADHSGSLSDMIYFSFTTLTTLGYGDMSPAGSVAKTMTILESTTGQVYMTVLIARLVGLHLVGRQEEKSQ